MAYPEQAPDINELVVTPQEVVPKIAPFTARTSPSGISYPVQPDVMQGVNRMVANQMQAREAFPLDRLQRAKIVTPGGMRPARDVMLEGFANDDEVQALFNSRGGWVLRDSERGGKGLDVYNKKYHPEEVSNHVKAILQPATNLIDRSLDNNMELGLNTHGSIHADRVERTGRRMLTYLGANNEAHTNLVLMAQPHDIGNLFDRKSHAAISPRILQAVFPAVKDDPERWRIINRAILLHDSENLSVVNGMAHGIPAEQRLTRLADLLKPEGLALIIADKADIGIDRISGKLTGRNVHKDPHAVVNLLGKTVFIGPEGGSITWKVEYNTKFTDNQREKLKHIMSGWESMVATGEVVVEFEDWERLFWKIYTERAITMVEAALALFPTRKEINIVLSDATANMDKSVRTFRRESLDQDIARLRQEQSPRKQRPQNR